MSVWFYLLRGSPLLRRSGFAQAGLKLPQLRPILADLRIVGGWIGFLLIAGEGRER